MRFSTVMMVLLVVSLVLAASPIDAASRTAAVSS